MYRAPDSLGDVTGEYLGLRGGAGLVRGRRAMVWADGPDAVAFLDGQLSQDIGGISSGGVARSFLLDPRGKLRALLWVLAGEERVGLVADRDRAAAVGDDLERFRFRVDVTLSVDDDEILEVWGPAAPTVLEVAGVGVPDGWWVRDGAVVARCPLGGLPRFLVLGVPGGVLERAGAVPVGRLAAEAVRIEAGEPVMGEDVFESTIPQETGLVADSVSFTKGCFLGQELVARIDTRGHVNRHLRGVVLSERVLPQPGAEIVAGGKTVGTLTSVAESPTLGAPVGLALVRREVEPGTGVEVRWERGAAGGRVEKLPLDDFVPT